MKFPEVMILSLSLLLLLLPSIVVESSSSTGDNSMSNITRGSSLSSNDTSPNWLSPSGNIAFGFYQLPWYPNRYVVGIWFVKSSAKTLVWTANPNELPLDKPSSILFTKEGKLVLRILPDKKDTPLLPDVTEPVSYAKLHDNGNFVLYGSESQILWESFDHPSDTILGGQKLKLGVDQLISNSGEYRLSLKNNELVILSYDRTDTAISSEPWDGPPATPPATLNLDTTGMLYLVDYNGAIREVFYKDKNRKRKLKKEDGTSNDVKEDYIYRATLKSRGDFILYKERIDGNVGGSVVQLWASYEWSTLATVLLTGLACLGLIAVLVLVGFVLVALVDDYKRNKDNYNIVAKEVELS